MSKLEQEVKNAYADCWMDDWNKAEKIRNLDFRASKALPKEKAKDLFFKYVESYNAFAPELLDYLPDDSLIQIAREGSVCIYVSSPALQKLSVKQLNKLQQDLDAYELDYDEDNEEYRIWWD